jgi:hypothetical protein
LVFGLPVQWTMRPFGRSYVELYAPSGLGFDHLSPLDATADAEASRQFCANLTGILGVHSMRGVGVSGGFADLCNEVSDGAAVVFRRPLFRSPYRELPPTDEALLESLSAKFRSNLRRSLKQLQAQSVEFRTVARDLPGHTLEQALHDLFSLHSERAESAGRITRFLSPTAERFHVNLCRGAGRYAGIVRFVEACQGGQVIGSLYGFRAGARFCYYQSGFRDDFSRYSLGTALVYHAMLWMINEGVAIFDFLRGGEDYKYKWTDTCVRDQLVALAASPWARLDLALFRWQRAVRRSGRRVGTWAWLRNRD